MNDTVIVIEREWKQDQYRMRDEIDPDVDVIMWVILRPKLGGQLSSVKDTNIIISRCISIGYQNASAQMVHPWSVDSTGSSCLAIIGREITTSDLDSAHKSDDCAQH
ncbi:hypothetical protein EVAR_30028_1 [Eumeta japonica]|uniref:Uncharacterized protein n=1 Tax=Eumeta variegata TaxID=151549 RepID=A0A4C1VX29_EUMVA|nr:hypothetical protein EVAR_30028_1 [Eumeta japonica]